MALSKIAQRLALGLEPLILGPFDALDLSKQGS